MKKLLFIIAFISISPCFFGQMGINTPTPQTTLDVRAKNHAGPVTANDGVLVPRVSNLITNGSVVGQLVYLLGDPGGFYFWDGTQWTKLSSVSTYTGSIIKKQPLIATSENIIINTGSTDFSFRYDRTGPAGWWQIRYNGTGTRKVSVFTTEHWVSAGYSVQTAASTLNAGTWYAIPGSTYVGSTNELNIFRVYDLEKGSTIKFEGMLINSDGQLKESMILEEF